MAHAYASIMEEELTCCVCYELFVDPHTPKELNCPHVICELCLKKLVKEGNIDCPSCRVITKLPKDGVSSFRTNLQLCNLAEKHQMYLERQHEQGIRLSAATKDKGGQVPFCLMHEGEKMHFICETCSVIVCQACVLVNHRDQTKHQIKDINHKVRLKYMKQKISKVKEVFAECEKECLDMEVTEQNITFSIASEEKKIDAAGIKAKVKVDKQCSDLKTELRKQHEPKLQECQRQKKMLQERANDLQRVLTGARQLEALTSQEFVQQYNMLEEKLASIQTQERTLIYPEDVRFKTEPLKFQLGSIRSVEKNTAEKVVMKSTKDRKRKLKLCVEMNNFTNTVDCVASNHSGSVLAISELGSNLVLIYCKQNEEYEYKRQSSLNVPRAKDEHGLWCNQVAIAADETIYVARHRRIHKYTSSGEYQKVIFIGEDKTTLSYIVTTPNGKIVIASNEHAIILLTCDGDVEKTVQTEYLPLAIAVIRETLIAVTVAAYKISVIDLDSEQKTWSITPNYKPWSVCYDKQTYSLLISIYDTDKRTNAIEQYSLTTGAFIARLVQVSHSSETMVFAGNNTLVVGAHKRVKLYRISLV